MDTTYSPPGAQVPEVPRDPGAVALRQTAAVPPGSTLRADDEAAFRQVYSETIHALGLGQDSPETLQMRQRLMELTTAISSAGVPKSNAFIYALEELGLGKRPSEVKPMAGALLAPSVVPQHAPVPPDEITLENIGSLTLQDIERIKQLKRAQRA